MGKLPSFMFYPGDWKKDPALRLCSLDAKGLWIELICLLFETEKRGILRSKKRNWTRKDIMNVVVGCTKKMIDELIDNGVLSLSERSGTFYCKRLIRDELRRRRDARRQRHHRLSRLCHGSVTHPVTPLSVIEYESVIEDEDVIEDKNKELNIPILEIIDVYHEKLSQLPRVRKLGKTLKKQISARWKEEKERQTLSWWTNLFKDICNMDFLLGKKTDWRANLLWITGPKNMEKILSGSYEKKKPKEHYDDWKKRMIQEGTWDE